VEAAWLAGDVVVVAATDRLSGSTPWEGTWATAAESVVAMSAKLLCAGLCFPPRLPRLSRSSTASGHELTAEARETLRKTRRIAELRCTGVKRP